ncbi:hypothetical protein ACET3Z_031218 [Daucus carota]
MEPWSNLQGKVVMVTGASSGFGRELCMDLAKAASEPGGINSCWAAAVELDVAGDGKVIKLAVAKAWKCFGRIDSLVNNAGIRGSWLVSKYVGLRMVEAVQEGCIINISSSAGTSRTVVHGAIAYGSSKTGLNKMTKCKAFELGKHNIRVNSISPDIFLSEITESLMKQDWLKNVAARTGPLKAFLTSDPALTSLVRYLIHDSSNYVTGNNLIVDAGFSLPALPIFSSL